MRTLLLLILLLLPSLARADFARHVCHAAPNIEPIVAGGACTGFTARDARGREVARVTGYSISGSILASPDGRSVVMLQHYPDLERDVDQRDGLIVFRDGKRIARYSIGDLVQRMELTTESISHVSWLADRPLDLVLARTLRLVTTSQRALALDVITGKLDQRDTPAWTGCELLVAAGSKLKPAGATYTIANPRLAKGTIPGSSLAFRLAPGVAIPEHHGGLAICLVPGDHGWVATGTIAVLWNRL